MPGEGHLHRRRKRIDQRRDGQLRQVDFLGARHLQQPVERPFETVDRQHRRRAGGGPPRRVVPGVQGIDGDGGTSFHAGGYARS